MKPAAAEACRNFYQQKCDSWELFNFKEEIVKYCRRDVEILEQSLHKFRDLFKSCTNIDPITRRFTLASIALEFFRTRILKPGTICIVPSSGFAAVRNFSATGAAWLDLMSKGSGLEIIREYRIGNYYADGFNVSKQTIYEYFGCRFHGCPKCYVDGRDDIVSGVFETPAAVFYSRTMEKLAYYRKRGFKVVQTWECEAKAALKKNEYYNERRKYWSELKGVRNADIRESFYGGRTENFRFFYELTPSEVARGDKISYIDVCSLYPTVLVKFTYMIGEPVVINENFLDVGQYFGFVKCKVLPPRNLHYPVLPLRVNGKLMFPLCELCAIDGEAHCHHSSEERCLRSTRTTVDLQMAVSQGYQVLKIYEVIHFPNSSDELFKEYINTWLKIKSEASGYPSDLKTEEQKKQWVQEFYQREGILLDRAELEKKKNPGRRAIAKLMLNSLWEKLAQRSNMKKTEIVTEPYRYVELANDEKIELTGEIMANDSTLILSYKNRNEEDCSPGLTSVAVSSFVTSYARQYFNEMMLKLEAEEHNSVLYCDTDSLIFIERGNAKFKPRTGTFLGDWTDEIEGDYGSGSICTKFFSAGPKNYGYQVWLEDGEIRNKIKTKGITLSSEAMEKLNFETLKNFAVTYGTESDPEAKRKAVEVPQMNFLSGKFHSVFTVNRNKKYSVVFDKRAVDPSYNCNYTYPYGGLIKRV